MGLIEELGRLSETQGDQDGGIELYKDTVHIILSSFFLLHRPGGAANIVCRENSLRVWTHRDLALWQR